MEVVKKEVNNNFFVKHEKSNSEFYLSLVNYLNPAYAIPNFTQLDLQEAAYAYFNSLIIIDGIVDKSFSSLKIFEAINGIEKAIRLLSTYFSKSHNFWSDFEACKLRYIEAISKEKKHQFP